MLIEPLSEDTRTLARALPHANVRVTSSTRPDAYDLRLKRIFGKHAAGERRIARQHVRATDAARSSSGC